MQLFFTPQIDDSSEIFELSSEESKHLAKVLRKKEGDEIHSTNGRGLIVKSILTDVNQKNCRLKIVEKIKNFEKRDYRIHIAIAPTKNNDRTEWFVEKACEIGVDEISLIICQHSERKTIKTERLEKIAISAMKQSLKAFLPKINQAISFDEFVEKPQIEDQLFIAHLIEDHRASLKNELLPKSSYLVLIGPEGDFSPEELKKALKLGYKAVSLGSSRLRTETAAMVAVHSAAFTNE